MSTISQTDARWERLREAADRLLAAIEQARDASTGDDLFKAVTGRSALENAAIEARRLRDSLDRSLREIGPRP